MCSTLKNNKELTSTSGCYDENIENDDLSHSKKSFPERNSIKKNSCYF